MKNKDKLKAEKPKRERLRLEKLKCKVDTSPYVKKFRIITFD
jgi:hypothetical protein